MRKHLCLWLVGGAAVFAPAIARAEDEPKAYPECTKTPTDAETAAAKGAFQAGSASFSEADYPRAITYWEDAYRRDCTANLLLKNLASAYELYGQKRQAVVALETFLVREPNSPDKEQIQRRIEVLKGQIASEKSAPVATATQPPVAPPVVTRVNATPVQPEPAPEDHNGKRSIAPLFVAGAGAVITIVGIAVVVPAANDVKTFDKECPNRVCTTGNADQTRDDANAARKKEITGGVLTGIGAVALAGGLIWYFAQPRSSAASSTGSWLRPHVDPALTRGFAGLALSGAF